MGHSGKTIVFDVGGVLVDLDFEGMFRRVAERSPLPAEEVKQFFWPERTAVGECDSTPLAKATAGRLEADELLEILYSGIRFQGNKRELLESYHSLIPSRKERTLALFRELCQQHQVAVLSNTNALSWQYAVDLLPELERASGIFLSYEVGLVKPDFKLFEHVSTILSAPNLIFIDDSLDIIERAKSFGWQAIHYQSFPQLESELKGILR
jgi:FMN phosphatase YigB (HAD superfamily)